MYSYFYPSEDFVNFIKELENDAKVGYDASADKWVPVPSPEGGLPTIAYGHKVTAEELSDMQAGITDYYADEILKIDIEEAYAKVANHLHSIGVEVDLTDKQSEMLTEFTFNLGSLKSFPKFTQAVLNQDWEEAQSQCIRSYTDASGTRHPLTRRNDLFIRRFF